MTQLGQINTQTNIGSDAYYDNIGTGRLYYLSADVSDLVDTNTSVNTRTMTFVMPTGTATASSNVGSGDTEHLVWSTPYGSPGVYALPKGNIKVFLSLKKNSGTKDVTAHVMLYKQDVAGTQTLLASGTASAIIGTGSFALYESTVENFGPTILDATDRLLIKSVYNGAAAGTTANISTQMGNVSLPAMAEVTTYIPPYTRDILTAPRTYYVRTDGTDTNTGLANTANGAFLTIQRAIDVVSGLDLAGNNVTIQLATGTYSTATANTLKQPAGAGTITIVGDETTPANVVVKLTAGLSFNGGCFYGDGISTKYIIKGIQFKTDATTNYAINVTRGAKVDMQNCDFNAGTQNFLGHLRATYAGSIVVIGNYKISAGCTFHAITVSSGSILAVSVTVTLTGTPAWGLAMAYALLLGFIDYDTVTFSGSATGTRYTADTNAVIYTNGGGANYFPGNVAGTTSNGGQYQ